MKLITDMIFPDPFNVGSTVSGEAVAKAEYCFKMTALEGFNNWIEDRGIEGLKNDLDTMKLLADSIKTFAVNDENPDANFSFTLEYEDAVALDGLLRMGIKYARFLAYDAMFGFKVMAEHFEHDVKSKNDDDESTS